MPLLMCPNDNSAMQTLDRNGVQFDMCPSCRGVWLDRGELDKIIERSAAAEQAPVRQQPQPYQQHQGQHGYGHKPYKRRKSFLEELFD